MAKSDILILAGLGAGAFVVFTDMGRNMFEDITGIEVPRLDDIIGDIIPSHEDEDNDIERYVEDSRAEKRGLHPNYYSKDYYYPIQDLFVPPNYYKFKYQSDPYRVPSERFADWYAKGSGLIPEDYYYPPHYLWNPDYYFFNGNLQRRWYPNVYDITQVPTRRVPYWFGEVYY